MEQYVNEWYILHQIERFCLNWKIQDWNWDERNKKPIYKYNKTKAINIIRDKYKKAEVWWNIIIYCYKEEDLENICNDFLNSK